MSERDADQERVKINDGGVETIGADHYTPVGVDAVDKTPEEDRETAPYREFSVRRYAMALCLFALSGVLLFADLPIVGRAGLVLLASPPFLLLVLGWYGGRSFLSTVAHLAHRRRHKRHTDGTAAGEDTATPSVSILIPAYNEATQIGETITSTQQLDYTGEVEIVVVDDGSSDGTWYALQALAEVYGNLRIVHQENAGSAAARNTALAHAVNEVVISLDADTVLHASAITEVARHFTSEKIVAVGGNVSVENMEGDGIWARLQVFDYALAMEIGRMFQTALGFVLCLSGAFGAFRRETLLKAGGWNEHWLYSDDFEVSIRMHEHGEVKYSPRAIADTVVPTTISGWFHQRKAWAQRGISVMLLHHKKQFNPKDGMIGLIGLPMRAILTSLIILEVIAFGSSIVFGGAPALASIGWVVAVALVTMTGFCAFMLGVLVLLLVDEKPIEYALWVLGYLFFYRPFHAFARLYGFAQALWWEVSSLGGSLRANPKSYLTFRE